MRLPTSLEWEQMSWYARQTWHKRQGRPLPPPPRSSEVHMRRLGDFWVVSDGRNTAHTRDRVSALSLITRLTRLVPP